MKKRLLLLFALTMLLLPKASFAQEVSIQYFHESLGYYGTWIHVDDYGDCWQPYVSDPDWRPYSLGHWAYTDQGWLWVSDEPFGWATYHYGNWINIEGRGWCWVPGYEWAPAWVSWRYGDGYCGWAPMPPSRFGGPVGPGWYNFCEARSMGEPSLRVVIINRNYNYMYMNRTTFISAAVNIGGVRISAGPSFVEVNRFAGARPVPHYNIQRTTVVAPAPFQPRPNGGSITVYSPAIRHDSPAPMHPYPSAEVKAPVVNNGRNSYHQPEVGPYAVPSAVPQQNRAANPSVYRNATAPTPSAQPQQQSHNGWSGQPGSGQPSGGQPYQGDRGGHGDRDDRGGHGH